VVGGGVNSCTYTVSCGMVYTDLIPYNSFSSTSISACIQACDNDNNCFGAQFQISTETCEFFDYLSSQLTASLVADSDFVVATFDSDVGCTGVA
jgi:hypothetical protein